MESSVFRAALLEGFSIYNRLRLVPDQVWYLDQVPYHLPALLNKKP